MTLILTWIESLHQTRGGTISGTVEASAGRLTYGPSVLINAASDLMFEVRGPWAHVLGLVMLGIVIYLVYRTIRRHRRDQ